MEKLNKKGSGMAIGMLMGVAIGASTDNLGMWMAIGIAIGAGLEGTFLTGSEKEDKTEP
jgi:hypothetical protein